MEVSKLAIQKFMYTGLVAAVAAPMVLASFSSVIDTPWGVALNRSVKVPRPPRTVYPIDGGPLAIRSAVMSCGADSCTRPAHERQQVPSCW